MDAINKLEKGTYNPSQGQKLWWVYYDRAILAVAVQQHALFTVPLGQAGKNLSDTNLTVAGEIPQGQNFTIRGIEMIYWHDAAKSTANYQLYRLMLAQGLLEFWISSKSPQLQINLLQMMGSANDNIVLGTGVGDQASAKSADTGRFELPVPIVLASKTNFRVDITHTAAVNTVLDDDEIYINLVGELVTLQ